MAREYLKGYVNGHESRQFPLLLVRSLIALDLGFSVTIAIISSKFADIDDAEVNL